VEDNYVLVHAGLLPSWTVAQAQQLAHEVEAALRGKHYHDFFVHMYGSHPNQWQDDLTGHKRMRVITNALTRMRICTAEGEMEFKFKGEEKDIPEGYWAWFNVPSRTSADVTVVCGHWSALGLKVEQRIIALDTGCLWGGPLSAIRLEDRLLFQVNCKNPVAQDW